MNYYIFEIFFVLISQREKYYGSRENCDFVKYVLKFVKVEVVELWDGNFQKFLDERLEKLWMIVFCGEDGRYSFFLFQYQIKKNLCCDRRKII